MRVHCGIRRMLGGISSAEREANARRLHLGQNAKRTSSFVELGRAFRQPHLKRDSQRLIRASVRACRSAIRVLMKMWRARVSVA